MNPTFVIETRGRAAGIALREKGGFRFFAAAAPFHRLDKRLFRRLAALRSAVDALASGEAGDRASRRPLTQPS